MQLPCIHQSKCSFQSWNPHTLKKTMTGWMQHEQPTSGGQGSPIQHQLNRKCPHPHIHDEGKDRACIKNAKQMSEKILLPFSPR